MHVSWRRSPFCLKTTARWSSVLELTYIRMAGALDVLKLKATSSLVRLTSCGVRRWCTTRASRLAPATASGRKLYLTSVPASKNPPTSGKYDESTCWYSESIGKLTTAARGYTTTQTFGFIDSLLFFPPALI